MMKLRSDVQSMGPETPCSKNNPHRIIFESLLLMFLLFIENLVTVHAQQYLATISGEVHDPSGAEISDATIAATDQMTKFVTKTTTGNSGGYTIPSLSPGTYSVTINANGFREELRTGIALTAGSNARVDFSLSVGSSDVKVLVTADTALLDTTSANLGTHSHKKKLPTHPT